MFFIFQIKKENEHFLLEMAFFYHVEVFCILHASSMSLINMKVALEYRDLDLFHIPLCLWNQSKLRSSCSSARFKFVLGRLCSTLFKREGGPPSYICPVFWNSIGLGKDWTYPQFNLCLHRCASYFYVKLTQTEVIWEELTSVSRASIRLTLSL